MYGHLLPALQRQTSLRKNLTSQSRITTTASPKNQKMVSVDFRNWPMHFDMNRCTSNIDRCTCINANWCGSAPGLVYHIAFITIRSHLSFILLSHDNRKKKFWLATERSRRISLLAIIMHDNRLQTSYDESCRPWAKICKLSSRRKFGGAT